MEKFDIEVFLYFAKKASKTEYYQNSGWCKDEMNDFIHKVELYSSPEFYPNEEVLQLTEALAFANPREQLPQEVADLVLYGYSLALEINDAPRINDLGVLYYDGRIGLQDFKQAAEYYKIASDLGMSLATENLGYIYYYGRTGEVNYEMAYQLFSKASAVYRRACSTYKLGDMFKNGYYVTKDLNTAYNCYRRARMLIGKYVAENDAQNVAPDIYFRLGECYHLGLGTSKDLDKALRYYHKAEQGFIVKVRNGDFMVKKMLIKSIERQDEVREILISELPNTNWARKNRGFLNL